MLLTRTHCPRIVDVVCSSAWLLFLLVTCSLASFNHNYSFCTGFFHPMSLEKRKSAGSVAFFSGSSHSRHHHGSSNSSSFVPFSTEESDEIFVDSNNDNDPRKMKQQAKLQQEQEAKIEQQQQKLEQLENHKETMEQIVARQNIQIQRLQKRTGKLEEGIEALLNVFRLLRQSQESGTLDGLEQLEEMLSENNRLNTDEPLSDDEVTEDGDETSAIFGTAPSDVLDAADSAGASILAAVLAGQQRLLVDVRDADLASNPDVLTQFVELACLPVAAGLEGLQSQRNRLKLVFPTVPLLLQYRQAMTLSAPDVMALSTLSFDPVEDSDNLVVVIAPTPDDTEGWAILDTLLGVGEEDITDPNDPTKPRRNRPIRQPVVVLNHHMAPVTGMAAKFEVAYHLRLLSVQYMSAATTAPLPEVNGTKSEAVPGQQKADDSLEAAVEHAHRQGGGSSGMTRAMVIRGYPNPWHVFVDTSPSSNTDFVVAATFENEPIVEEVNLAIVECLEGSEQEEELVAKQMQEALETGQLDHVSDMLGGLDMEAFDDDEEEEEEDEDDFWDFKAETA